MQRFSDEFLMRSCSVASIVVASLLIIIKSINLYQTSSFGIQASLLDSVLDILASIINFFAIRKALQPPTYHYRFGYGKAEALAGLFQSVVIACSALWLIADYVRDFLTPTPVVIGFQTFFFIALGSCLTLSLILWQRYVLKRVKSLAVQADAMHYENDLYLDLGVLFNFLVIHFFGFTQFDFIFGTTLLLWILHKTYPIFKQSFDVLMDKELDEDIRNKIIETIYKNPHVKNVHQLRTRSSGQYEMIQFHIVLNGSLTLYEGHQITHDVEKEILKLHPKAHIIIHQDCHQDQEDPQPPSA